MPNFLFAKSLSINYFCKSFKKTNKPNLEQHAQYPFRKINLY